MKQNKEDNVNLVKSIIKSAKRCIRLFIDGEHPDLCSDAITELLMDRANRGIHTTIVSTKATPYILHLITNSMCRFEQSDEVLGGIDCYHIVVDDYKFVCVKGDDTTHAFYAGAY